MLAFLVQGDNVGAECSALRLHTKEARGLCLSYNFGSAALHVEGSAEPIPLEDASLLNYQLGAWIGTKAADGNLPAGFRH